jgi:hypothetical protein
MTKDGDETSSPRISSSVAGIAGRAGTERFCVARVAVASFVAGADSRGAICVAGMKKTSIESIGPGE